MSAFGLHESSDCFSGGVSANWRNFLGRVDFGVAVAFVNFLTALAVLLGVLLGVFFLKIPAGFFGFDFLGVAFFAASAFFAGAFLGCMAMEHSVKVDKLGVLRRDAAEWATQSLVCGHMCLSIIRANVKHACARPTFHSISVLAPERSD